MLHENNQDRRFLPHTQRHTISLYVSLAMESSANQSAMSGIPAEDLRSFQRHLARSKRILVLLGAGLSASSGLPTFRGAGGLWRSYDATALATPEAFKDNPGLVWQFYSYRRHLALQAKPNRAHLALAELARLNKDFITLSQNVDGMFCDLASYSISILC